MSAPAPTPAAMAPRTLNLIVGLIRSYMGLTAEQVVIYNQKWKIPTDERLYISVGLLLSKPYAPITQYEPGIVDGVEVLKEIVTVNSQESLSVNMYSRGPDAVDRKDEVLMAFASTAGQQLCERNSIKLGQLPIGFTDASGLEGVAMLNRFVMTINVLVARRQERIVEYFDQFQTTGLVINP